MTLLLGADETVHEAAGEVGRRFLDETAQYWREWVRFLGIPYEWQEAVIRAAITLKLNAYDDTGAIIAAMTTSIPEAAGSGRNWDYRYCWLRDGYFVVNALNRLGATRTMERYLGYIVNIAADAARRPAAAGLSASTAAPTLEEREVPALPGYRGMGPVRVGNQAYRQVQHDVYGSAILAATHVFFDRRLTRRGDEALFQPPGAAGRDRPCACYDQPDAGLWELRGSARVHTFSAVMCWAACDRLARIAAHLGLAERADYWRGHADRIHAHHLRARLERQARRLRLHLRRRGAWMPACCCWPRSVSSTPTIRASPPRSRRSSSDLRRGDFIFRYVEKDDFGEPENAFLVCTFWYVNALAALGRARRGARAVREAARLPQPPRPAGRAHRSAHAASSGATSCRPTAWSG